jgi:hypothetical protein
LGSAGARQRRPISTYVYSATRRICAAIWSASIRASSSKTSHGDLFNPFLIPALSPGRM